MQGFNSWDFTFGDIYVVETDTPNSLLMQDEVEEYQEDTIYVFYPDPHIFLRRLY